MIGETPMDREEIEALLVFLANGTLEGEERARVEAAVAEDPALAAELEALKAIRAELQGQEMPRAPGEFGLARLMRDIDRDVAAPAPQVAANSPSPLWRIAAVVALGLLALQTVWLGRPDDPDVTLAGGEETRAFAEHTIVVTFVPSATEAEIRELLLSLDLVIVDGLGAWPLHPRGVQRSRPRGRRRGTPGRDGIVESASRHARAPPYVRVSVLVLALSIGTAEAQTLRQGGACVDTGDRITISGSGFGRSPTGQIVILGRGQQLPHVSPAGPRGGSRSAYRAGAETRRGRYRVVWARPGNSVVALSTFRTCGTGAQGTRSQPATRAPNRTRSPRDVVDAPDGSPEYIVIVANAQAGAAANAMQAAGAQLLRTRPVPGFGQQLQFYAFPGNLSLNAARGLLQGAAPSAVIDLHNIYRLSQARLYAAEMLGDPPGQPCQLRSGVRIGVIDGPVNPGHPALAGASVTRQSVLVGGDRRMGADHGTAVAGLIAGPPNAGPLAGLSPGARIFAAEAFGGTKGGEGAKLENLVVGLSWMAQKNVRLVNMSFSGSPNQTFQRTISLANRTGMIMVAAAGNDGSGIPRYPAAAGEVIAVTAVDARGRAWSRANSGGHIEFAAPGVDIYVAKGSGGGYRSGTSYAAPIVTALLARQAARGGLSTESARRHLRAGARDLGPPGRDARFGYGLVQSSGC